MRVLIVNDDPLFTRCLTRMLSLHQCDAIVAPHNNRAAESLTREQFDALLFNCAASEIEERHLVPLRRVTSPLPPAVLFSQRPSVAATIQALRKGVADVLPSPIDATVLLERLQAITAAKRREPSVADSKLASFDLHLAGSSRTMANVRRQLERLAEQAPKGYFILGEPGSGHVAVARSLHALRNAEAPFVYLHAEAQSLSEDSLAEHLWVAGRGTLFIKGLAGMPPSARRTVAEQVASATEKHQFDGTIAIEWTTNGGSSGEGPWTFGSWLLPAVLLPPLRKRLSDVEELATLALASLQGRFGAGPASVSPAALSLLQSYAWPGNASELITVLKHAAVLNTGLELSAGAITTALAARAEMSTPNSERAQEVGLREVERATLIEAFTTGGRNMSRAAQMLGIPRTTLRDKLRRYGIT